MALLEGAFPVLATPMHHDETVDFEGMKQNIEHYIGLNVAGIIVNGSTGEFVSLTKEEKFKLMEVAAKQVNSRIPLVIGTAAETTADAVEYTKKAESVGADAALLINSYYAHPKENEIYEHFKTVAESVSLPIMIYNNPFTSGIDIETETILQVGRDVDNITHVKESSGEIRKVRDISRQGKDFIKPFCGSDDLVLESFLVGATGWVSVAGNLVPELATELYTSFKEGDLDKAWKIYDRILPLCNFLEESGKYVQIVKRGMELQGLAGGPSRKPRLSLKDEEDATLQEILSQLQTVKQ